MKGKKKMKFTVLVEHGVVSGKKTYYLSIGERKDGYRRLKRISKEMFDKIKKSNKEIQTLRFHHNGGTVERFYSGEVKK